MNSLYKQVSNNILEQITTGQLKVGDRLPPENDFANEIGVSRSTLRLAFDELESVGVLSRRKRTGTTIIADEPIPKITIPQAPFEAHLKFLKESVYKIEKLSMVNAAEVSELEEFDGDSDQ